MFSNLQLRIQATRITCAQKYHAIVVNTIMRTCTLQMMEYFVKKIDNLPPSNRCNVHRLRWFSVICSCYFIEPLFVFYSFTCAAIVASSLSEKCLRSVIWRDRNDDPAIWSITNQVSALITKLSFGAPNRITIETIGLTISGAISLAVSEVNSGRLKKLGHSLTFLVGETYGEEVSSIRQTASLWTNQVAGYIGPQETCVHEGRMAAAFNLPMISYVSKLNVKSYIVFS